MPYVKRVPNLVPEPEVQLGPHLTQNVANIKETNKLKRKRSIESLKKLKDVNFIPSFLLRTLNDYLHNDLSELSKLQRTIITFWLTAGLGKKEASEQIMKLYGLGVEVADGIEIEYFTIKREELDKRFIEDIKNADLTTYFNNPKKISPIRIANALKVGSDQDLKKAEKALLEIHNPDPVFIVTKTKLLDSPYARAFIPANMANIVTYKPPTKPVTFYRMQAKLNRFKILESSDGLDGKADPRFLIHAFHHSDITYPNSSSPPYLRKITFNSLGDNLPQTGWILYEEWVDEWEEIAANLVDFPSASILYEHILENMCDINVFPTSPHMAVGVAPIFVVRAFEDDTWLSDASRAKAEVAFQYAKTVSKFDPTGYLELIIAIEELAWDILCFLDDLNPDDELGIKYWAIDENSITLEDNQEKTHIFDFKEPDGDNHWQLEIVAHIFDPSTIQ